MHHSFHQLIQEQSQCVAEEGLELQPRGPGAGAPAASGEPACPRPGAGLVRAGPPAVCRPGVGVRAGWGRSLASCVPGTSNKPLCSAESDRQALLGPEGAVVHSTATLRILASMPSRTIGEWEPLSLAPAVGWAGVSGERALCPSKPGEAGTARAASLGSENEARVVRSRG